ncbi:uncharacterized protein LOC101765926 [Setaria italica]|uniref:uncharacterized protein LOC101765926 n=1 Tax=Setaria italica TaxID=4555 RepID=UPI0003511D0D|nr:uncharacterized protein LOC101765926 [Setaria italica]
MRKAATSSTRVLASCVETSRSKALVPPQIGRAHGLRQTLIRFQAPAHGSSSSSNLSFTVVTDKKVYEDQLRGIICYRDENGEMICEGYDEGPRLRIRLPEKACFPWPVGIQVTDFIQLATLQVFEDVDAVQLKDDQKRKL